MKRWTIIIDAPDEATALVYIDMMKSTFKAAIMMGLPMNHCIMEDPAKGEKLICTAYKRRWSWLKK
jgi:hypothetical protein